MKYLLLAALALNLARPLPAQAIGEGSQVRFRSKGFCLDQSAGFRCFKGGTRGTVEQVTRESVMVRLDKNGQLVSWDPGLQGLELSVLTGHHSRGRRGLIGLAIGGVSGVAFGLVAPSLVCLFCSESDLHSVQRKAAVGLGLSFGAVGALAGLALPTSVWTTLHWIPGPVRPVVAGLGGPARVGLSIPF